MVQQNCYQYQEILTKKLGKNLHYLEEIDSTNTYAKNMKEWHHGQIIIAGTQTAGRGTYGRKFYSKAGNGIYMTVMIDTNVWHFKQEKLATLYTAVAVSEAALEVMKVCLAVKWVNDLFVNRKKVGGILTEKELGTNKLIIGIGINLSGKQQDFPEDIKDIATSLELTSFFDEQAAALVVAIYEKMFESGKLSDESALLNAYKEKLFIMGEEVDIEYDRDRFTATVVDIDHEGRLIVLRDGEKLSLTVGDVRVRI